MRVVSDDDTSLNDDTSKDSIDDISENFSEALINYLSARDPQWQFPKHTQEEQPKQLYVLIKTEEEEPLPLDIVLDEMYMSKEEVVFKIHTKGYFEYDPLRYVNGSVSSVCAFTHDRDVFSRCLDHIMSEVDEHKWALFYRIPKRSLDKGLRLLHTGNDGHSFFDVDVKNGFIHLYVAHKKQNLGKYYYKNMEWEEEDAGLWCFSSTPFTTRYKRKISNNTKVGLRKKVKTGVIHDEGVERKTKKTLVNGANKGKKVFEDEGMCSKGNNPVVTIYKRAMVNGKAKMVEDVGAAKTGRDRGVVITEGDFNNVARNEQVVSKRGVRSRKMQGSIVKVESE
ncbi:hypothetical protein Tco_0869323 [Tanacetum coccineum]